MIRCDWATVGNGKRWHAFARTVGPEVRNANGETQLIWTVCGIGPGRTPYASVRPSPACATCVGKTRDDNVFTVLDTGTIRENGGEYTTGASDGHIWNVRTGECSPLCPSEGQHSRSLDVS